MSLNDKQQKAIEKKEQKRAQQLIAKHNRQAEILDARRRGLTFSQIAKEQGRDVANVHRDYKAALDRLAPIEDIEDYRRVTMLRLEAILEDALTNIELADSQREWRGAVDVALKTTDRLIRVTGLDKHEPPDGAGRVDVTVTFNDVEDSLRKLAKHGVIDVSGWESKPEVEVPELPEGPG